jgi:hypothetical protein
MKNTFLVNISLSTGLISEIIIIIKDVDYEKKKIRTFFKCKTTVSTHRSVTCLNRLHGLAVLINCNWLISR